MSLLSTASPYHSREDEIEIKNNKKTSNRRKATMPSISSSSSMEEAKKYMSQLIQNKEPLPSSYSDELYSYQSSGISDMLYPTLEDSASKNIQNPDDDNIKIEEKKPEITEMPSFYKKNKVQQNSVTSALQKLTGSKTITQEGMMDISSSTDQPPSMVSGSSGSISPPYMPTMPAFTMDQMNDNSSPINYLKSSQSSQNMFSDYSSSYSKDNYVVPPNLSQYSYPIMMRASNTPVSIYPEELHDDMGDRTQQVLLEKINYMIYLLEQQKKEKSKHTTEEFVLYSFLGVFVIYLADSFARSGRYIR